MGTSVQQCEIHYVHRSPASQNKKKKKKKKTTNKMGKNERRTEFSTEYGVQECRAGGTTYGYIPRRSPTIQPTPTVTVSCYCLMFSSSRADVSHTGFINRYYNFLNINYFEAVPTVQPTTYKLNAIRRSTIFSYSSWVLWSIVLEQTYYLNVCYMKTNSDFSTRNFQEGPIYS